MRHLTLDQVYFILLKRLFFIVLIFILSINTQRKKSRKRKFYAITCSWEWGDEIQAIQGMRKESYKHIIVPSPKVNQVAMVQPKVRDKILIK